MQNPTDGVEVSTILDLTNETTSLTKINVKGSGIVTGKVVDAFVKGGKNQGASLTVRVPSGKVNNYESLFKGEGRLNEKATVEAA